MHCLDAGEWKSKRQTTFSLDWSGHIPQFLVQGEVEQAVDSHKVSTLFFERQTKSTRPVVGSRSHQVHDGSNSQSASAPCDPLPTAPALETDDVLSSYWSPSEPRQTYIRGRKEPADFIEVKHFP